MTNAAPSLWPSDAPSRGATASVFEVDRDLESELMAGLSGPVRERAEAPASGAANRADEETADADAIPRETSERPDPAIDAGLEAALIEGLSGPVRERAEAPASGPANRADEETADADATSAGPDPVIDTGLEAALIEDLSGPVRERAEAPASGPAFLADEETADADATSAGPDPAIDTAREAAPIEDLSGPVRERAEAPASGPAFLADEETADADATSAGPDPAIDTAREAAPIEGLSGPVRERAEAPASGPAFRAGEETADADVTPPEAPERFDPAIDTGLETALIEGLSSPVRERAEAPASGAAFRAGEETADVDATPPETSEGPDPAIDTGLEAALIEGLSGPVRERAEAPASGPAFRADEETADADATPSETSEGPDPVIDTGLETALIEGLSGPVRERAEAPASGPAFRAGEETAGADATPRETSEGPDPVIDTGLETALIEDLSGPAPDESEERALLPLAADLEPVFAEAPPASPADVETSAAATPEVSEGPIAALAFALDPDTEAALHEALSDLDRLPTAGVPPMVWRGGLQAAISALAEGHSTPLLLVDLDETPYPAGALHKLATVCDVGTVVIAIGSNATAQVSREVLLAGVSDYLTKPIAPAAVREAIAHALRAETAEPRGGRVAGFLGVGGSGATTLVATTALHASASGHYVSILDLNRMVPSAALMLDLEPAPGLDHLLETSGRSSPDPEIIDAIRTERSARLAVYAYRSSESLPRLAEKPALTWLIAELRRRSHLVLIDGVDDLDLQLALLDGVDTRVLVAEPGARDAGRAARLIEALGSGPPVVLVQNQTRRPARDADVLAPVVSGSQIRPDFVVPFEPSLSRLADQGWPQGRLPRSMTKPLAALVDRILSPAPATGPDAAMRFERS